MIFFIISLLFSLSLFLRWGTIVLFESLLFPPNLSYNHPLTMISAAEAITAMFGGVVALNIHLLISNLTSVPRTLYCLSLGPTYVLALQVIVAVSIVRMQCIILNQPFQLRSRKIKALLFLYAIFPMPYLVILVNTMSPVSILTE